MTYKGFLAKLHKTPRDWFIEPYWKTIRRRDTDGKFFYCPLAAVFDVPGKVMDNTLSDINRLFVIAAADDNSGHDPKIRNDLLKACGLAK